MGSGYTVNGADLDDYFEPYTSGTKAAATNKKVNGVDLNQRYAKYTSGTKAPTTGHTVNGTDLRNIFAAKTSYIAPTLTASADLTVSVQALQGTTSYSSFCDAVVANGKPPYAYTLTKVSGQDITALVNDNHVQFGYTYAGSPVQKFTSTYRWTVTDGAGNQAHDDFTVTVRMQQ